MGAVYDSAGLDLCPLLEGHRFKSCDWQNDVTLGPLSAALNPALKDIRRLADLLSQLYITIDESVC